MKRFLVYPDVLIYLRVSPEVSMQRIQNADGIRKAGSPSTTWKNCTRDTKVSLPRWTIIPASSRSIGTHTGKSTKSRLVKEKDENREFLRDLKRLRLAPFIGRLWNWLSPIRHSAGAILGQFFFVRVQSMGFQICRSVLARRDHASTNRREYGRSNIFFMPLQGKQFFIRFGVPDLHRLIITQRDRVDRLGRIRQI